MATAFADVQSPSDVDRAVELLGGPRVLGAGIRSRLDAHKRVEKGFPVAAVTALAEAIFKTGNKEEFQRVLGISDRTIHRKGADTKPLSVDQSSRAWSVAEIYALAERVHGEKEAHHWMETPTYALNGQRPLDLITTAPGIEAVQTLLMQIEYGVYV